MHLPQSMADNILLNTMAPGDYALLEPSLRRIELPARRQLHAAKRTIDHVYFLENGIVSVVAVTLDGKPCEVGLFGREGMSETATVMGSDRSSHDAYVQTAGTTALGIPAAALDGAMGESTTMRLHLLRYVQAMMVQLSTSIAAAGQTIEQRLARWLLMYHDRVDGDIIPLTHEMIAMMLGVRRAGITVAIRRLSGDKLVTAQRGHVVIDDRQGLEQFAAGGYGLAEAEYVRLIGVALRRQPGDAHRVIIEGN